MPTPPLTSAASISHRTGGLRQPLSIEARSTLRTSCIGPFPCWGVNPRSFIQSQAAPIVITSANHGLVVGQQVTVSGVLGNTAANGTWTVGAVAPPTGLKPPGK